MPRNIFCLSIILIFYITLGYASNDNLNANQLLKSRIQGHTTIQCNHAQDCSDNASMHIFYNQRDYKPAWTESHDLTTAGDSAINLLSTAYLEGLNPNDYHTVSIQHLLQQLAKSQTAQDQVNILVNLDLSISDGLLLYMHDLYYSKINIKKMYPDWTNIQVPINLVHKLQLSVVNPQQIVNTLEPRFADYNKLKSQLLQYQQILSNTNWPIIPNGATLKVGMRDSRIKLIRQRLSISGELAKGNIDSRYFDTNLENAVITFQENNGIFDDGIVNQETLDAMNIPIKKLIQLIELNMDRIRLLPNNLGASFLLINLPAYSLDVIQNHHRFLTMDVAVGGMTHPSCILNSQIQYLVLNPYWNIPQSIAESEIWAAIKQNPNYFNLKHIQMFQSDSHGIHIIDSNKFNWHKMTKHEFNRYRYRQSPGELNALGKVKFFFQNTCGIYLHDTNESQVFEEYNRAFSHGCIRISQPLNLTTFILNSQKQWSIDKVASMFKNDINRNVKLVMPYQLYIVYQTAFVDRNNILQFRPDIYHLDDLSHYNGFIPAIQTDTPEPDDE